MAETVSSSFFTTADAICYGGAYRGGGSGARDLELLTTKQITILYVDQLN